LSFKKKKTIKGNGESSLEEVLFCKYCSYEVNMDNRPSDAIRAHMKTDKHNKLKDAELKREKEGKQLTLTQSICRSKVMEKKTEGFIHDFVRAACFGAIPREKADKYIAILMKKYVPSAKSLPQRHQIRDKYLPEVYESHVKAIKNKKLSLIIDECPQISGRPALNVLISYFDSEIKDKRILLIKTSIIENTKSTTILNDLLILLEEFSLTFNDVLAICSDSAEYMKKLVSDIKTNYNNSLFHITDVSHLIHISVMKSLKSQFFNETENSIVKIGAIFKTSNKLCIQYVSHLNKFVIDAKLTPRAIESRWWSVLKTSKVIRDQWQYICNFFDHLNLDNTSLINKKVEKIISLLGHNEKRRIHYLKITHLVECFSRIEEIEKQLEVSAPNSHKFYDLLNVHLKNEIQNMKEFRSDTNVLLKNFDLLTEKN
jgi:DNA-binding ferritin-like protein (Dps family)